MKNFVIPAEAGIHSSRSPIKTFGDDTYQNAVSFLKRHNVPDADISASSLLSYVLKKPRLSVELNLDIQLTEIEEKEFESLVMKRAMRYPLQYLMKSVPFRNAVLEIGEGCLIPRPETELLINVILERIKNVTPSPFPLPLNGGEDRGEGVKVLEIGTGSGNIAISLAMERPHWTFTATDLSEAALRYARKNSRFNQADRQINFIETDLFPGSGGKFDAIISNPPYLKTNDLINAQAELSFEPAVALDGGEDGLSFYRRIIAQAKSVLKKGGFMFFEIGFDQANDVRKLMENFFESIEIVKDYSGHERIVSGRLKWL